MSIRSTNPRFETVKVPRFRSLDKAHIQALESIFDKYKFLQGRVEIHLPFGRAKQTFSEKACWVWEKFDKRPATYLIFCDGFAPCIWDAGRQEGLTLRWILPPGFCQNGPVVCLANMLAGESVIQIEDLLVNEGVDLWNNKRFSERWNELAALWNRLPADQPLLAIKPRIIRPLSLEEWKDKYDPSISWIIQPDVYAAPRYYWRDVVTKVEEKKYIEPQLKRKAEITTMLVATCKPYAKSILPDTYSLFSQEGDNIGIASIGSMDLSKQLRSEMSTDGIPVELVWNDDFNKYKIIRILPKGTSSCYSSFFSKALVGNA